MTTRQSLIFPDMASDGLREAIRPRGVELKTETIRLAE
jgi:hypothetical protein